MAGSVHDSCNEGGWIQLSQSHHDTRYLWHSSYAYNLHITSTAHQRFNILVTPVIAKCLSQVGSVLFCEIGKHITACYTINATGEGAKTPFFGVSAGIWMLLYLMREIWNVNKSEPDNRGLSVATCHTVYVMFCVCVSFCSSSSLFAVAFISL